MNVRPWPGRGPGRKTPPTLRVSCERPGGNLRGRRAGVAPYCGMTPSKIGAATLAAIALAASAAHGATSSLPAVSAGARPGPDLLYAPAPDAPQLQNTGPWEAEPILVSGAEAYRDGEFLYQDFLFDDHGATGSGDDPNDPFNQVENMFSPKHGTLSYPTDTATYANNAADLVELRVKPLADATAFR